MHCNEPPPPPRPRWEPNDGIGPRGYPDCYYKSRTLNSTFRYVRFVKKLRATEEEQRKGDANNMKELVDQQISDFFRRCDRRSLINNVARRVDLCMRSYEEDLKQKRKKLVDLLQKEEEEDIRKFVVQAQAGANAIWQDKLNRLQYLLDKRKKEHEMKYKDLPIMKCVHVLPCIYKIRAKEAQQIQLYQMREKEARQLSERELEKMWYECGMKESEALTARMEQDAIERYRRDIECKEHSDMIIEQRKRQKEIDRANLKKEQLAMQAQFEEDKKKEEEEDRKRRAKRNQLGIDRENAITERKNMLAKQEAEENVIREVWDSLSGQGIAEEKAKIALMRRKEYEQDECNRKMTQLKNEVAGLDNAHNYMFEAEAKRRQDIDDRRRCDYLLWSHKTNADVRKAMIEQIKEKEAKAELEKKLVEQEEYHNQVFKQQEELIAYKNKQDALARKRYQQDLIDQIEYNKLLKERAKQEELEQVKKGQLAAKEYENEMRKMLSRPFFVDDVHPFMKQMAGGLEMKKKCPCSKQDYCK
ncbi:apical junction molecule-like [Pectinophora gossypiella]|uniref:apical junction molecule-like n=1 Tax=Pectinophora gossypiella TaxID=13191 RepID=UPI00214E122D|nr:apical junction molecule-like [Pectinophora gossypiella]